MVTATMRVGVTGSSGLLGEALCEALERAGHEVRGLDLRAPEGSDRHGDIRDLARVIRWAEGCDGVVHLAAVSRVVDAERDPERCESTNVTGTANVASAAASAGAWTLFASSREVYGKNAKVPFSEDDDSVLGASSLHRWSYACAKLLDEFLALAWFHEHKLPVTVARFFNVTGPRQCPDYGMVLPRFCAAALSGNNLEVHGTGLQSRCFLHVDDLSLIHISEPTRPY